MRDPSMLTVPRLASRPRRSDEIHEHSRGTSWNTSDENLVPPLSAERSGVSSDALYPPTTTTVTTRETLASDPMRDLFPPDMSIETPSLQYATSALSENAIPGPSTSRNAPYASAIPSVHEPSMYNASAIDLLAMQPTIYQSHFRSARAPPSDPPVCIGHGLDAPAIGVLSTLVLPTAIGLSVWVSPLFISCAPRTDLGLSCCSLYCDLDIARFMGCGSGFLRKGA